MNSSLLVVSYAFTVFFTIMYTVFSNNLISVFLKKTEEPMYSKYKESRFSALPRKVFQNAEKP